MHGASCPTAGYTQRWCVGHPPGAPRLGTVHLGGVIQLQLMGLMFKKSFEVVIPENLVGERDFWMVSTILRTSPKYVLLFSS